MLELREKEILRVLERIKELNFVLIGGYAINSYTQPRFSVDCDLVSLNKEDAEKIKNALMEEGYAEKELPPNMPYTGQFLCLAKKIGEYKIPFDILIGGVIDRKTGSKFPAKWIYDNSEVRVLQGKSMPAKIKLRIAKPDALIIMKIASGRKSDLRDVFMLLEKEINPGFVMQEIKKHDLSEKLGRFKEYIASKGFRDSLQGVFGKVDEAAFKRIAGRVERLAAG